MTPLQAGAGRADISPPIGTYLAGFGHPFRTCKSVRDPLTATVLVLDDGNTRVAIVALDALSIHEDTVAKLREAIESAAGVPRAHTFVACSHSHCAPVASVTDTSSEAQARYVDALVDHVRAAAAEAAAALGPASLLVGRGENTIAVNRRETDAKGKTIIGTVPDGPVDRDLLVAQLRRPDGEVVATIVNLACHPTCLSPKHRFATAAWPGQMRAVVEPATGAPVLFVQGATGDLNPDHSWGKGEVEAMVRLGRQAGEAAVAALGGLEALEGAPLSAESVEIALPLVPELNRKGTPMEHDEALGRLFYLPRFAVRWLLDRCYPWRCRQTTAADGALAVPMEVQVLRIGDLALIGWAAEVFHGLGVTMKAESPARMTLFGGYTNGMIGYLPTAEEHARGGYEVDMAPYFYRLGGRLDPGAGAQATEQSRELLRGLFDTG